MDAYVLIQTWPEGAPAVLQAAQANSRVVAVDRVEGAFDLIVRVPAEDEKEVLLHLLRLDETIRALVCRPPRASALSGSTLAVSPVD